MAKYRIVELTINHEKTYIIQKFWWNRWWTYRVFLIVELRFDTIESAEEFIRGEKAEAKVVREIEI
jgi:hypothetical protein